MEIASQMILFARVVDAGSFSAAARDIQQTPSSVSKQISRLEDHLGVRLMNRSTRKLSLTEEGRTFYQRAREIAHRVDDAEAMAISMGDHPQGTLRVSSTVSFGKTQLLPIMPAFLARYPDIRLSLELTDRRVDMISDDVDVAIRFTEQIEDEEVIAKKIVHNSRIYVASPDYLAGREFPVTPDDLTDHNCIGLMTVRRWNRWTFFEGEDIKQYNVRGDVEVSSADGIYHAVLCGLGIARLSTYLVHDDLKSGRLVRVLPDYADEGSDLFAIFAQRRNMSPKIRAFIDALRQHFSGVPPWEREQAGLKPN